MKFLHLLLAALAVAAVRATDDESVSKASTGISPVVDGWGFFSIPGGDSEFELISER